MSTLHPTIESVLRPFIPAVERPPDVHFARDMKEAQILRKVREFRRGQSADVLRELCAIDQDLEQIEKRITEGLQ